jgi:hypothetical protein
MNPVFLALHIRGFMLLLTLLVLTIAVRAHGAGKLRFSRAHNIVYLVVLLFIVSSGLSSIINNVFQPLIFSLFFAVSALVVLQTEDADACAMVEVASRIFAVFIVMAAIGVIYRVLGGEPLITLSNPGGGDNNLYLTTFANVEKILIRPSAIYDEPGAFSFYICILVILRSRLGLSLAGSAALLFGGMLTQSITHVMFTFLWFIWALQAGSFRKAAFNRLVFALFFVIAAVVVYHSGVLDWTIKRAEHYYKDPSIIPRWRATGNILDALAVNPEGVWFGFDATCTQRQPDCSGFGENPLTPLIYGGLFASWPYYLFLLMALTAPFVSRDGLLLFGAALLLSQRPYLLEFPYSALFALGFVVWFTPRAHLEPDRKAIPRERGYSIKSLSETMMKKKFFLLPPKKSGKIQ